MIRRAVSWQAAPLGALLSAFFILRLSILHYDTHGLVLQRPVMRLIHVALQCKGLLQCHAYCSVRSLLTSCLLLCKSHKEGRHFLMHVGCVILENHPALDELSSGVTGDAGCKTVGPA